MLRNIARIVLILSVAFLSLTALAGGIGLLTNLMAPPLEYLQGSLFTSYLLPGLSLMVIVGGSALAAMILLLRRHPLSQLAAILTGVMIIGFETVEIMIIGALAGVARGLQVFYLCLGMEIIILGSGLQEFDRSHNPSKDK